MVEILAFALINFLGAMSPGPDFAIVVRYGLTGSRKASILATAGIAAALVVHVLYCVFGIVLLIQNSKVLFSLLHFGGALYLAYLGIRLIQSGSGKFAKPDPVKIHHKAFRDGFLTNLLNPKASLFLLSLFTQFIEPDTTLAQKIVFGTLVPLIAFAWFSFLSVMLTHRRFLPHLQRYQKGFTIAMGVLLLALAAWVVLNAALHL